MYHVCRGCWWRHARRVDNTIKWLHAIAAVDSHHTTREFHRLLRCPAPMATAQAPPACVCIIDSGMNLMGKVSEHRMCEYVRARGLAKPVVGCRSFQFYRFTRLLNIMCNACRVLGKHWDNKPNCTIKVISS